MAKDIAWNVDGHRLIMTVNKSVVDVAPGICPHGATKESPCYHDGIDSCVVNYFINTYGLETNHGVVAASTNIEIAWATSGSQWDVDLVEFMMIPVDDPNFKDWYSSVSK